jgi:hypothetical protein
MAGIVCKCGSALFLESHRVSGWWKTLIDGDGESVDSDLDSMKHGATPKTVKCAECGKTNPNPRNDPYMS